MKLVALILWSLCACPQALEKTWKIAWYFCVPSGCFFKLGFLLPIFSANIERGLLAGEVRQIPSGTRAALNFCSQRVFVNEVERFVFASVCVLSSSWKSDQRPETLALLLLDLTEKGLASCEQFSNPSAYSAACKCKSNVRNKK